MRYPEQNSFILTKLLRIYKPYLSWEKSVGAEAVAREFPRSAAGPAEKCGGEGGGAAAKQCGEGGCVGHILKREVTIVEIS